MCTNFKVKTAKDGSVVVGRTMEFPAGVPWVLGVIPVGYQGSNSQGGGMSWTSKYGIVGMSLGEPQWMADGMNTAGLSAHDLFMANHCTYADATGATNELSQVDIIAFLLGTCATVAEVKKALDGIVVSGMDPGMGFVPPMHTLVHDKTSSIAIEFHADGLRITDNPTSVATNPPFIGWHLQNLNNYVGISASNPEPIVVNGVTFAPLGQGSGLRGLPGDFSPPSRFVRAFAHVALADAADDSQGAEMSALHILNHFDIHRGLVREIVGGKSVEELTTWSSIANLTAGRYSFRAIDDPTVYAIDLASTDFTKARTMELPGKKAFTPFTI